MKNRAVVWVGVCLAVLALGLGLRRKLGGPIVQGGSPDPAAPTMVVALYDPRPTSPPSRDPLGVHVADVGVGPKGAKLLDGGDPEIREALKTALGQLAARPFLPALGESREGDEGTTIETSEIKPGDERYAWAVGGFLRERTGLRYEVRPAVERKAP